MPYQVFFIYYLLCFVEGIIIFLFIYECSIKLFNCSQSKKKKKNFNQGAFKSYFSHGATHIVGG